jgi:hypothetical protein
MGNTNACFHSFYLLVIGDKLFPINQNTDLKLIMQIQEIITYLIVAMAAGFVLLSLYKTLFPSKDKLNQHGCSGGCNCDAKVMRKELLNQKFGFIK